MQVGIPILPVSLPFLKPFPSFSNASFIATTDYFHIISDQQLLFTISIDTLRVLPLLPQFPSQPNVFQFFPEFGDLGLKQAQKLQSKMLKLQEELAEKTVETSAGGGMVRVVANGKQQIVSIDIEKEVVDPDDVEMLQDLIVAAINEELGKAQEMVSGEMGALLAV